MSEPELFAGLPDQTAPAPPEGFMRCRFCDKLMQADGLEGAMGCHADCAEAGA